MTNDGLSEEIAGRPGFFDVAPASAVGASEVAAGVWMSPGLSNAWLLPTRDGRIVVNTGMGFEAAAHRANFDAVDDGPIRYLIFTQGHVDHVGGADVLSDDESIIVAQANNAACQADDERIHQFRVNRSFPFFASVIGSADDFIRSGGRAPEVPGQSHPTPDLTFEDRFELQLGGRDLVLISTPGGETIDSLVVWLPNESVVIAGNLFSALFGHFPNLVTMRGDRYRFVTPFLESLALVRELGAETLCVGHFDPIRGARTIDAELGRIADAVTWVHDAVLAAMNRGDDVWAAMREIRLPENLAVGEGYGKVSWSVRAIWESYAGWFHQRSTTELFGLTPDAGDAELVELAGGATVVAAAARQRLEAGEPLRALRLAEATLALEESADGLAVARDAQVALLDAPTRNFWEVRWLEWQIALLEHRRSALS